MAAAWCLLCVLLAGVVCSGGCWQNVEVEEPGACSLQIPGGVGLIDLTSLGNTDNTPRFSDVKCDADDMLYSYNPCGSFVEGTCMDAAVCVVSQDKSEYHLLGVAGSQRYQYDSESKTLLVGYFTTSKPYTLSEIEMTCDVSACAPQFSPIGPDSRGQVYKMKVRSICACPDMCSASGPTKDCQPSSSSGSDISGGSIFLIALSVGIVMYFVIGATYMKVKKKATGTDLIPNKDMWKNLPKTVKSGFMFLLSKCTSKKSGYVNS